LLIEASVGNACLFSFVLCMLSRSWAEALTRLGPEKGGSEAGVASAFFASSKSGQGSRPVRHPRNLGSYSFRLPQPTLKRPFPTWGREFSLHSLDLRDLRSALDTSASFRHQPAKGVGAGIVLFSPRLRPTPTISKPASCVLTRSRAWVAGSSP